MEKTKNGSYIVICSTKDNVYFKKEQHNVFEDGFWEKWEYNEKGQIIRSQDAEGFWEKWKYKGNGNKAKYENSSGFRVEWKNYKDRKEKTIRSVWSKNKQR